MTAFLAIWITLAPVLTARQEVAVATARGRIYLMGGIGARSVLSSVEEYDPATNEWRFVAPLPEPLHHAAAAAVDEKIYVLGGYKTLAFNATDAVYRYDPLLNSWTAVAPMPSRRGAHTAAVIGRRIYIAGPANELSVYDVDTNAWSVLAPMPTAREHLASGVIDGKLYVAGGRRGSITGLGTLEVYDPLTNEWSSLAPMPTGRSGIAGAVVAGRLYIFGGEGNPQTSTGVFSESESYDPNANSWRSELPMPVPRHGIGAAVIDRKIYIPAGAQVQGFGVSDIHDSFVPDIPPRRRPARRR